MRKIKKLEDLKKDLQIIKKKDLGKVKGGRTNKGKGASGWNTCGGFVPQ